MNIKCKKTGRYSAWMRIAAIALILCLAILIIPFSTHADGVGTSPWTATLSIVDQNEQDAMSGPWHSSERITVEITLELDVDDLIDMGINEYMALLADPIEIAISKKAIPDNMTFVVPMIPNTDPPVPAFVTSTLSNYAEDADYYYYTLEFNTGADARGAYQNQRAIFFELEASALLAANPPTESTTIIKISDSDDVTVGDFEYEVTAGPLSIDKKVTQIGNVTTASGNKDDVKGIAINVNDEITFTITVSPPSGGYGVLNKITDTLGTGLEYVRGGINPSGEWTVAGQVCTIEFDPGLEVSSAITFTLVAKVTNPVAASAILTNNAEIEYTGGDNSDEVKITQPPEGGVTVAKTADAVYNASGVAVSKIGSNYPIEAGYVIRYKITVTAGSTSYAILTSLSDTLTGSLEFAAHTQTVAASTVGAMYTANNTYTDMQGGSVTWAPTAGLTTYNLPFTNGIRIEAGKSLTFYAYAKVTSSFTPESELSNKATATTNTGSVDGSTGPLPQISEGPATVDKKIATNYYKLVGGAYVSTPYTASTALYTGDLLPFTITVGTNTGQYTILKSLVDEITSSNMTFADGTEVLPGGDTVNDYYAANNSGYTWAVSGNNRTLTNLVTGLRIEQGAKLTVTIFLKVTADFTNETGGMNGALAAGTTLSYTNKATVTPGTGSSVSDSDTYESYPIGYDLSLTTQIVRRYNADGSAKDSAVNTHISPLAALSTKLTLSKDEYVRVNVKVTNDVYTPVDGVGVILYVPDGFTLSTETKFDGYGDYPSESWQKVEGFDDAGAWSGFTAYTTTVTTTSSLTTHNSSKTLYVYLKVNGGSMTDADFYLAAEIHDFRDKATGNWASASGGTIVDVDSTPNTNPLDDLNSTSIVGMTDEKYNNSGTKGVDEDDFDFTFINLFSGSQVDLLKVPMLTKSALTQSQAEAKLAGLIGSSNVAGFKGKYTYATDGIFKNSDQYIVYEIVINNYGIEKLHTAGGSQFKEILPQALKIYPVGATNAVLLERYSGNPRVDGTYIDEASQSRNAKVILLNNPDRYFQTAIKLSGINAAGDDADKYGITAALRDNGVARDTLELTFKTQGDGGEGDQYTDPFACYKLYIIMIPSDSVYESNQRLTNDVELIYNTKTYTESEKTAHWAAIAGGATVIKQQKLSGEGEANYSGSLVTALPDGDGKLTVDYRLLVESNKSITAGKIKFSDTPKADAGIGISISPVEILLNNNSSPVYLTASVSGGKIEIENDGTIPAGNNTHSLTYSVEYSNVTYGKHVRNAVIGTGVSTVVPVKLTLNKADSRTGAHLTGYEFSAKWENGTPATDTSGNPVVFNDQTASVLIVPPGYDPTGGVQTFKLLLTEEKAPNGYNKITSPVTVTIKSDANGNLTVESVAKTSVYKVEIGSDLNAVVTVYNTSGGGGPIETPTPGPVETPDESERPTESEEPTATPGDEDDEDDEDDEEAEPTPPVTTPRIPDITDFELPEGSTIVQNEDGEFIVFDEDGVPLGRLELNDEGEWIFIPEDIPLADAPPTDDSSRIPLVLMLLSAAGILISLFVRPKRKGD